MGVNKLAIILYLFQSIRIVQSVINDVPEMISMRESIPKIDGTPCTSRTLRHTSTLPDNNNITTDDNWYDNVEESDTVPNIFPQHCPDGYFCDLTRNDFKLAVDEVFGICKTCSGSSENCMSIPTMTESTTGPDFLSYSIEKAIAEECQEQCGAGTNTCSSTTECLPGLFCNFENDGESGHCEGCPPHRYECITKNLTSQGLNACDSSCSIHCYSRATLGISILETERSIDKSAPARVFSFIDDARSFHDSPQLSSIGPIVDCKLGLEPCEDAEGSVCLIERGIIDFKDKAMNCFLGGGIASVIYNVEQNCENFDGSLWGHDIYIPVVSLTYLDGKAILDQAKAMPLGTPLLATVEVGGNDVTPEKCVLGCTKQDECEGTDLMCNWDNGEFGDCTAESFRTTCNDEAYLSTEHLLCTNDREFCDYSKGALGECLACPKIDGACFFSDLNSQGAIECNEKCAGGSSTEIESKSCKFCTEGGFTLKDISDGFETTEKEEVTTPCEFCAYSSESTCSSVHRWDMMHPYRNITLFGTRVECWAAAEFYRGMNIEANTVVCDSARTLNYICGCSDSIGYAGANNDAKKKALVWLPRIGAILSIFGSSLMIITVVRNDKKRKSVVGELSIFLCSFDIFGSLGYAFTSYPTPKEDYIYGAEGNEASCTVQGFFIQVGTIALYFNVSIAIYYFLIIQCSWREHRLRKSRVYYMLFIVPIVLGSIFAFAGIPFYDNNVLWCNNSWKYWSEIPVAVAILVATVIMVNLCWFVYKSESASSRFRRHNQGDRNSLTSTVFKQSLVYLGSFYLTWPAYLAMQIMIANGRAFSNYRFFLYAGTSVTLQGFWNCTFHIGMDFQIVGKALKDTWSTVIGAGSTGFGSVSRFSGFGSVSRFSDERRSANDAK